MVDANSAYVCACVLSAGTGKTVYVKSSLDQLGKGLFHIIPTAFSAQTSANQVCTALSGYFSLLPASMTLAITARMYRHFYAFPCVWPCHA